MTINVLMPALSPTMTEGTIANWMKTEGYETLFCVAGDAEEPAGPYEGAHAFLSDLFAQDHGLKTPGEEWVHLPHVARQKWGVSFPPTSGGLARRADW